MTTIVTENTTDIVLSGAKKLYEAVSTTMGPRGNNVIFRKAGKRVGVTHDGVTVAKAVTLGEGAEDVGADLLKEAAMKLDSVTGDGTTTVTVLAYHMLQEAVNQIKAGKNPMKLKLELDRDQIEVLEAIKKHTKKAGAKEIAQVAMVASGDKEIGTAVGELINKVGKDVPILLELSQSSETTSEVINGFKIYSGSASPYLLDEAGIRHEAREVKVIVCDAKFQTKDDILPILKLVSTLDPSERRVLLVANEVTGDALSLCLVNNMKGFADMMVVKTPSHIKNSTDYLSDLVVSVGGNLLSRNGANSISNPGISDLGSASRVVVELTETLIVEGGGDQEQIANHVDNLQKLASEASDTRIKKFAEDRIATIGQKIAVIRVGGQSETEVEEKNYRYEDAIGAAQSAIRKGVLPGGGTLFYELSKTMQNPILKAGLEAPIRKIYENAGIDYLDEAKEDIKSGYGFDVTNEDKGIVDLVKAGILDPAESEEECIRTAVAIAGLLMTSGAIIVDEIKENQNETKLETSIS